MRLSPEEFAAAEKLHASVRGFEKTRRYHLWKSALAGGALGLSLGSFGGKSHSHLHDAWIAAAMVGVAFFLVLMRKLAQLRYERDKVLLQVLERDHADELPWTEEERQEARVKDHLAAVREIQREVAHVHG